MNSVLQQLCASPAFLSAILDPTDLTLTLLEVRRGFAEPRSDASSVVCPSPFWEVYALTHPEFSRRQQEDAVGFFNQLINTCPARIARLFHGRIESVSETLTGEHLNSPEEPFTSIDLYVANSADIFESLPCHFAASMLTGENQFFHSRPGRKVDARGTMPFSDLSSLLVCHLKRFDFSVRTKLDKRFDFGSELDELGRKGSPILQRLPIACLGALIQEMSEETESRPGSDGRLGAPLPTAIEGACDIYESE
jgi:hypothetical protein